MSFLRNFRADPWIALLLLAGAALLFTRLDNGSLWQDEAETAALGRNVLRYGYPRAYDGINWVNPALPLREGYAWTYHSWLPMVLAAGSFALLGTNTFAARLPFALLGWLSLWLGYLVFRRLSGDRGIARIATFLLVSSVPFLLHMRQCRYYAPAAFFTLWTVLAYWRFFKMRRWGALELIAALNFLFHSDHGVFLPVAAALALHFLSARPSFKEWGRGFALFALVLVTTVPWMIYLQVGQHHVAFSWKEVSHHLQFYFRQINRFLVPVVFWGILEIARRFRSRQFEAVRPRNLVFKSEISRPLPAGRQASGARDDICESWKLVGCLIGVGLLFLVFVPEQRHFRYLIFLVPFLLLIQAVLLARVLRSRWAVGCALTGILVLTDLLHYSGTSILAAQVPAIRARLSSPDVRCRSLFLEYLGELTTPYRGPMDGIVELLRREGKAGQSVKTSYEELSLIFYLPEMAVEPLRRTEDFTRETFPDWIILRRDWLPSGFLESSYYYQVKARYRQILLDAPDIPWQNRPDPGYHRFRTDSNAPPVIVFRKIQ